VIKHRMLIIAMRNHNMV